MTSQIIASIAQWFKKAKPEPTTNDLTTQMGVHCEEVVEMLDTLSGTTPQMTDIINTARRSLHALAEELKNTNTAFVHTSHKQDFLDSLCDQIVTATGVGVYAGFPIVAALAEVDASNHSKFDENGNPILNAQGKIMKGPNYFKARLQQFV